MNHLLDGQCPNLQLYTCELPMSMRILERDRGARLFKRICMKQYGIVCSFEGPIGLVYQSGITVFKRLSIYLGTLLKETLLGSSKRAAANLIHEFFRNIST